MRDARKIIAEQEAPKWNGHSPVCHASRVSMRKRPAKPEVGSLDPNLWKSCPLMRMLDGALNLSNIASVKRIAA